MVTPCTSLKVHPTKLTKPILLQQHNYSSPYQHGLKNSCGRYWLRYPLIYPCHKYCLSCLPLWTMTSTVFSTSYHWPSIYCRKYHRQYPPPVTKWMRPLQTSYPSTQLDSQWWHPYLLKILWWNYPEPHSLRRSITSYYPWLPPYWSIKTPSSPSSPSCGRNIPLKKLSNLHHPVPSTCRGGSKRHCSSYHTPCLQIPPTCQHRGWCKFDSFFNGIFS